jgi:hypothetical protein
MPVESAVSLFPLRVSHESELPNLLNWACFGSAVASTSKSPASMDLAPRGSLGLPTAPAISSCRRTAGSGVDSFGSRFFSSALGWRTWPSLAWIESKATVQQRRIHVPPSRKLFVRACRSVAVRRVHDFARATT